MIPAEALDAPRAPEANLSSGVRDTARLRGLVDDHVAFVWRSLVRLGVPRADAEDAVQQVFLIASKRVGDIAEGNERSFLFGTVLRIASRARRTESRRRTSPEVDLTALEDPAPSPEDAVERRRARAALEAILERMPLDLRAVFVLFELEQCKVAEIAGLLNIPPGTVASRLRRAREHFEAAVARLRARPLGGRP